MSRFDHLPESPDLAKSLFGGNQFVGAFPHSRDAVLEKQPPFPPPTDENEDEEDEDKTPEDENAEDNASDWGAMTLEEAEQRLASEAGEEPEADEDAAAPPTPPQAAPEPAPAGEAPPLGGPSPEAPGAMPGAEPEPEPPMGGPADDEAPMGQPEPAAPQPMMEPNAPGTTSVGQFLSSTIHAGFTLAADRVFGAGYLTEQERIALSSAISRALQAFSQTMQQEHPELHGRDMPTSVALGVNGL
jgi:hypothetical protein